MDNNDLLVLLGFGVVAVALAVVIPPSPGRPSWLPLVLGVVAAVFGLLVSLTVLMR